MAQILKKCRVCFSKNLFPVISLGNLYLSDFTNSDKKPSKHPLELVLCKECDLLQLRHTVSQKLLYTERYGYKSGVNKTMKKELQEIVKKSLKKVNVKKGITALDIGANDGTLLSFYPKTIQRIGVEPVEKLAKECKKHATIVINDFFNYKSYSKVLKNQKAHIITAISCFYDMEEPNEFIKDVKKILHEDGILIIQQNYLVEMLKNKAYDNIVHEHLEYYSLLSLENLLNRHDLEVVDMELSDINGGSFRTYIAHKNKKKIHKNVALFRKSESKLKLHTRTTYVEFAKAVQKNRNELYTLIKKLKKNGGKVYVYSASTRGNTLLQYSRLDTRLIEAAVERNPEKWGKKIASVGIPIISEEQARKEKPDYQIVLPWFFFYNEFIEREKDYLIQGGKFIIPLPELQIVYFENGKYYRLLPSTSRKEKIT